MSRKLFLFEYPVKTMADTYKLAKVIRSIRGSMTQKDLARLINVSQGTVAKYESGKSTPKMPVMVRLAQRAGLSVEKLLAKVESENQVSVDDSAPGDEMTGEEIELVKMLRKMAITHPRQHKALLELASAMADNTCHQPDGLVEKARLNRVLK